MRNAYALEFWPFPRTALERAVVQDGLLVLPEFRHVFYARALVQFIVVDDTNPLMSLGLVVTNHVFDTSRRAVSRCRLQATGRWSA